MALINNQIKGALTLWLVFTADVSTVTVVFQCVEQVAVVELPDAVWLISAWNLRNLNMTYEKRQDFFSDCCAGFLLYHLQRLT